MIGNKFGLLLLFVLGLVGYLIFQRHPEAFQWENRGDRNDSYLVGQIDYVMDGDTVIITTSNSQEQTVRLVGIDAPESDQPFGPEAKKWLSDRVMAKSVLVEMTGTDRYGRSLGNVYVDDIWYNRELVKQGLAWHYDRYVDDSRLSKAQRQAQSEMLGLWQNANPVPPWDFRKQVRSETAPPVGDSSPAQ